MERTSKAPAPVVSRSGAHVLNTGPVTWEYRFSDESPTTSEGTAAEGWIVASSSTRRDQRREYLLKRPLR